MISLLRKSTVVSATFMLLWQSVCLAAVTNCTCSSDASASAVCCCSGMTMDIAGGCPHCQMNADMPDTGCHPGNSVEGDSVCHCHLTVPASGTPVTAPETTISDGLMGTLLFIAPASFEVVCHRETVQPELTDVPIPDDNFRQVILCVWLT
ncbi:hypothetical protein AB1L30_12040 [Bremerella sp. JC817]|uniref:hypothetical protein n=1 Tax=Bremerella sp. JC817 TaxID=3231756 RepID=UPI003459CFCC